MSRTTTTKSEELRILSSVLRALMLPMEELQLAPESLLERCGIPPSAVEKSLDAVPLKKYLQFWALAAEESGDVLIGINLARSAGPETLGALGFLFLASPTLQDAMSNLCTYINLLQDATHVKLSQSPEEIMWSYDLEPIAEIDNRHDVEFSIALMTRLVRMYTGSKYKPLRVQFRHSPSHGAISEYSRLLGVPVSFEEDANAVILSAAAGTFRGRILDESLAAVLQEILDDQLARYVPKRTIGEVVYDLLYPGHLEGLISARSIAHHLSISEATLHRKLRSEGMTFSEIVARRRFEMAKDYLTSSSMEMTQIAQIVGFSEAASFTRAFKRWSGGIAPTAYRKEAIEKRRGQE